MDEVDDWPRLIKDLYAAALDAAQWAAWSRRAGTLFKGRSTGFYVVEKSTGAIRHQDLGHPDPLAVERLLGEGIWRFDPQVPFVSKLARPMVYTDTEHLDGDDPGTKEYLSFQRSVGKLRHYITAAVPLNGGYIVGLSIHYAVADGATPPDARARMEALLPCLTRALQLGFTHAGKLADAHWDGLLTGRDEPALLLDERGRILRCTTAMEAVFAAADGLNGAGAEPRALDQASEAALQAMLARAVLPASAAAGAVRIARRSGRAGYLVSAYPLARLARHLAPFEAAALVVVVDPVAAPRDRAAA